MKFRLLSLISVLVFVGALAAVYGLLFSFTPGDKGEYWKVMANADPAHSEAPSTPYIAKQQHRQTHKDIWYNQKGQRLHMSLHSADAELVLDHHDNTTEVVEHMYDVKCYMQEELYYMLPDGREVEYRTDGQLRLRRGDVNAVILANNKELKPKQIIRYMEAANAAYYYNGDRFVADNVRISQFSAPGHTLVKSITGFKPIMSGLAKSAEFSLVGNDLNFTAHQLKARLHTTGK
jgi:hypothetical protein